MSRAAIIVGASSGLGRGLAEVMAGDGWRLGLAARREEKLRELAASLPGESVVRGMDVAEAEVARRTLDKMIEALGGVDLVVISAGVGYAHPTWEQERHTVEINVLGFTALAARSMDYFLERGSGHLVGITSISGLRGVGVAGAYSASKAYMSRYLEAMRVRADVRRLDIAVTDIMPGFVDTPMTEGRTDMFWVADLDTAARQMYEAILKRKRHAYITRRWRLMGWLMKAIPYRMLVRMAGRGRR